MNKKFKRYVIEEIEELDEFAFALLIPKYLEKVKKAVLKGGLLTDYSDNYNISDTDFSNLQSIIKSMVDSGNYIICRYHDTTSVERKRYMRPLKKYEQIEFIKKKSFWIYKKDMPTYFLCRME